MPGEDLARWAIILGGSSGFGLACARELARKGFRICVVHRDRKGSMPLIEASFKEICSVAPEFIAHNLDALSKEGRRKVLEDLEGRTHEKGVRLLLHSIAWGSLKLLVPRKKTDQTSLACLAERLDRPQAELRQIIDQLFKEGRSELYSMSSSAGYEDQILLDEEELLSTIYAMGGSILGWTREIFDRGLFAEDGRVVGLTSEGNTTAWLGYAAVSAAKATLEALFRSIAREFGPHGIRANIVQPGVTDTKALRLIPGSAQMMAHARLRNPLGRLTEVDDVARVVSFLASDDANWINGSILRVDGGEHISG